MKSVIIYYSYTGNTKKTAEILKKYLGQKGEVNTVELKPTDESESFLRQCARAFRRKRALLDTVNFNLSAYDLVCFGTPVWAFGPAPAMNTYLDKCFGLVGKEIILFTTYGSGTGKQRCLDYMRQALVKKGARSFKEFSIQQGRVSDEKFVLSEIELL